MDKKTKRNEEFANLHSYSQIITVFKSVQKSVNNGNEASTLICVIGPYKNKRYGAIWATPARGVPDDFLIKYAIMHSRAFTGFVYSRDFKLVEEELAKRGVFFVAESDEKSGEKVLTVVRNVKNEAAKKPNRNTIDIPEMDSSFTSFQSLLNSPIPSEEDIAKLPETWEEFSAPVENHKKRKNPSSVFHSEIGLDGVNQLYGEEERGADDWLNVLLSKRIKFTEEDIISYAAENVKHIFSSGIILEDINVMKRLQKAIQREIVKEEAKLQTPNSILHTP